MIEPENQGENIAHERAFPPECNRQGPVGKDELYCALSLLGDALQSGFIIDRPKKEFLDTLRCGNSADVSLDSLKAEAIACTGCILSSTRKHVVFGEGVEKPIVLIVGEGPGAEEDAQGLPFVGASGKLLDKMLAAIGLSRHENCYIANIVKCRPPNNREPAPDERAACMRYLHGQIEALRPKAILCAGRTAAQALLDTTEGINRLRGKSHHYKEIPLVATYHPSALLRDESLKRPAWEDLKSLRSIIDNA